MTSLARVMILQVLIYPTLLYSPRRHIRPILFRFYYYSAPQFMFLSQAFNSHLNIQRFLKWVPSQTKLLGPVLNCVLHWCHLVRVMWLMLHQILSCSSLPVRHMTACQGFRHCFGFKWCTRKPFWTSWKNKILC